MLPSNHLDNVWLLSALSALAERPRLIKKLFLVQKYPTEGIHAL
jgi:hypothetical protein